MVAAVVLLALELALPDPARHPGPAPLILVVHGWLGGAQNYRSWSESLTAQGFAVALQDRPRSWWFGPRPGREAVTADLDALAADPRADRLDLDRVAVVGHSLGGAIAVEAAVRDPRIRALALLAPGIVPWLQPPLTRALRALDAPTLILSGTRDAAAPAWAFARRYARACGAPCTLRLMPGGTHLGFADVPWRKDFRQRATAASAVGAWFRDNLKVSRGARGP